MLNHYTRRMLRWALAFAPALFTAQAIQAQYRNCGTPDPTPAQMRAMAQYNASNFRYSGSDVAPVPLRITIVRDDAGANGTSEADVLNAVALSQESMRPQGIRLYMCGSIQYVNNTSFQTITYGVNENALCDSRDVSGVINVYFVQNLYSSGGAAACGYAYVNYPGMGYKPRVLMDCPTSLGHELGHSLGLQHTHNNNNASDASLRERVSGSNCTTAGDQVCDTPADPFGLAGATQANCVYNGTATDADGAAFVNVPLSNMMSYWNCGEDVTDGQGVRMRYSRTVSHASLSCTPPSLAGVTLQNGGYSSGSYPVLNWQTTDATSLGYYIERRTGSDTTWHYAGAAFRGAGTYIDQATVGGVTSYYRLRNLNNLDVVSNIVTFQPTYCGLDYSAYQGCSSAYIYMDRVTLSRGTTTLFDRLSDTCGYYSYYSPSASQLVRSGDVHTLTARLKTNSGSYYPQYVAAWIDYDNDKTFEDAELVYRSTTNGTAHTAIFTVPAGLSNGIYRLRVRSQYGSNGNTITPCTVASWGETEDYALTIGPPPITCVKPAAVANAQGNLLLASPPDSANYAYQWQLNNANIGGATSRSYHITQSGSYRVRVTRLVGNCDSLSLAVSATYTPPSTANNSFQWVRRASGTGADRINRVKVTPGQQVFSAGGFTGTITLDGAGTGGTSAQTLVSAGDIDGMLLRYKRNGQLEWAARFGGTGADEALGLAVDKYGYAYVSGYFTGTMTVDVPGAKDTTLVSAGGTDMFVAKVHPNGNLVWAFRMGASGNDRAEGVDVAPDLRFYVAGSFVGNTAIGGIFGTVIPFTSRGNSDAFLAKFSDLGSLYWAIQAGGTLNDFGYGAAADISGGGYLMGSYEGTATFNSSLGGTTPISKTVVGGSDGFVLGVSVTGQLSWVASMGGSTNENVRDVAPDPRGTGLVAVGGFSGTSTFGSLGNLTSTGFYDAFAVRLTPNGAFDWVKKLGGFGQDQAWGVRLDRQGNPLVAVSFSQSVANFGGTTNTLTSTGGTDALLVKLDASTGTALWSAQAGGTGDDQARGIDTADGGGALAGGVHGAAAQFGTFGPYADAGLGDAWTARYASTSGAREGQSEIVAAEAATLAYPNPAKSSFSIKGISSHATVTLYDVTGKPIISQLVEPGASVSVFSLPKGLYRWVALPVSGKAQSGSVVVE